MESNGSITTNYFPPLLGDVVPFLIANCYQCQAPAPAAQAALLALTAAVLAQRCTKADHVVNVGTGWRSAQVVCGQAAACGAKPLRVERDSRSVTMRRSIESHTLLLK